jgi:thiamine pyrophosphate-dependent acetolactate synthase large subunit-like protein
VGKKNLAELLVETLLAAGVKRIYGILSMESRT